MDPFYNQYIYNVWFHSYEEDTEEALIYRTRDFNFPLSRGRDGFEIKSTGEFIKYSIAATDGLRPIRGRTKVEGNKIKIYFNDNRLEPYVLNVISCDKDILKITK
jgi:hypothetical protein